MSLFIIIPDEFHYHIVVDHLFQMNVEDQVSADFFLNVLDDFETIPKQISRCG